MYLLSVGQKKIRLVGKEDVNELNEVLLDLNCTSRVSFKKVDDGVEEDGSETDDAA